MTFVPGANSGVAARVLMSTIVTQKHYVQVGLTARSWVQLVWDTQVFWEES